MLILLARMQFLCFKNKTKIIPIPSELSLVNRSQFIKMRYDDVIVYLSEIRMLKNTKKIVVMIIVRL
jgi:hypothetical protein